jgi:hypothetical protein
MASPNDAYREFFRRIHRTMAAYLAMVAWRRNLDCVSIERDEIVRLWGISKRVENQRLEWLKHDVKPAFAFFKNLNFTGRTKKFAGVFLARREFPTGAFDDALSNVKRAQLLTRMGLSAEVISLPPEEEMLRVLTTVIHGLGDPKP